MSSDGSVTSGSRIRQFGLYRTIDARTDEFLRSSRRRQIRQGCACAAISTAITVTVVVSVILVYEYSLNSETNVKKKIFVKHNWLGIMNESDVKQFDSIFTRKMNFDKSTLKLMPILLKALNKNRYLEKIIEDYSNSSAVFEGKDEMETDFETRKLFDSKQRLKDELPKIYSIDYRTSPVVHIKRPSQRSEYLNKLRKNRNYERMLNYFDKMINDKVGSPKSSEIVKKVLAKTESSVIHSMDEVNKTKLLKNKKNVQKLIVHSNTTRQLKSNDDRKKHIYCQCPKDLGFLLNKLIQTLLEVLPNVTNKNQTKTVCGVKQNSVKKVKNNTKPTLQRISTPTNETKTSSIFDTLKNVAGSITLPIKQIKVVLVPNKLENISNPITLPISSADKKQIKVSELAFLKSYKKLHVTKTLTGQFITSTPQTTKTNTDDFEYLSEPVTNVPKILTLETKIANARMPKILPSTFDFMNKGIEYLYNNYEIRNLNNGLKSFDTSFKLKTPINIAKFEKLKPTIIVPLKYHYSIMNKHYHDTTTTADSDYDQTVTPFYKHDIYGDYFDNTPKSTNFFDNLDVHTIELVKTKNLLSKIADQDKHDAFENNMRKVTSKTKSSKLYDKNRYNNEQNLQNIRKVTNLLPIKNQEEWIKQTEIIELPINNLNKSDVDYNDSITMSNEKKATSNHQIASPNLYSTLPATKPIHPDVPHDNDWKPLYHTELVTARNLISETTESDEHIPFENNMRKIVSKKKPSKYNTNHNNNDQDSYNMRKTTHLVPITNQITDSKHISDAIMTPTYDNNALMTLNESSALESKISLATLFKNMRKAKSESEIDQSNNEQENDEEEWVKQADLIEIPLNLFKEFNVDHNDSTTKTNKKKVESDDQNITPKSYSMLPAIRPMYLEVRRSNDWKPLDPSEYDMNMDMGNNIFDLPDI